MLAKKTKTFGRTEIMVFIVCLLIGGAVLHYLGESAAALAPEAHVRAGVGGDLLAGHTRGRQGLVGSLYHAPLPTLLTLPLLQLPRPLGGEWALVIVSLVSGAFLAACVCAWMRVCGITGFSRVGIALAVFMSPMVLREVVHGSSEPLFALLIFAACCLFMHWWKTDTLRSLAYLAVVIALAVLTRFQAAVLIIPASAFILVHLIQRRRTEAYDEATLIVFLTPVLYVVALWAVANWLIMGDPFFFMRGLANTTGESGHVGRLLAEGCAWVPALLLGFIALLARLNAAFSTERLRRVGSVLVLLACFFFWWESDPSLRTRPSPADVELADVVDDFHRSLGREWLLVSGYRGYDVARLVGGRHESYVHHTLNFFPEEVIEDTRGKRLYLLVPQAVGADRWEDINLKYPGIFSRPTAFTVYQRTWTHWRLWRVVRMDKTDRK